MTGTECIPGKVNGVKHCRLLQHSSVSEVSDMECGHGFSSSPGNCAAETPMWALPGRGGLECGRVDVHSWACGRSVEEGRMGYSQMGHCFRTLDSSVTGVGTCKNLFISMRF
ncbi:hypothetical protein KC19_2G202900 [Ceratodon purpureus]|uniref:Uncharacterized protein n=1 Tax=Ceratodon purpureus TaxID=3225 RepID=A0A8T0IYY5_CERPU|nr:hypothetical protein KC19_2G202900 [Ceratodon purpureus]